MSIPLEMDPTKTSRPPGNPIPVSQLRIPPKAVKEFERAQKAVRSGDVVTSVTHLQKALQIYPDYIQAHNSLGLRFIQLGDYQRALAEQETALFLDPHSAQTHQDLSLSLLLLGRYREADAEARESLNLDSSLVTPRYVLGRALINEGTVTSEAIEMLRQSENAFANASLVLAHIHFMAGRTEDTIAALRHYLRAPEDRENKKRAECWLAQLTQQPASAGCPAGNSPPAFR
jgi:tetratricopeptide (TPR) repeat protein